MNKTDRDFQESFEKINRFMENIRHSIQQSVELLAEI